LANSLGSKSAKTFDPSSGGMGIRLKIARRRFKCAIVRINQCTTVKVKFVAGKITFNTWNTIVAKIAKIILVRGPESATSAISFLPSFKLNGSIGTGFAAPKTKAPLVEMYITRGKRMVIIGSMCFLGFKVSRPASLAVGSPKRSATYP